MKAIFMTEIGGRLMEVDRRDIPPSPIYRTARMSLNTMKAITDGEIPKMSDSELDTWVCVSKPMTEKDFAVFMIQV